MAYRTLPAAIFLLSILLPILLPILLTAPGVQAFDPRCPVATEDRARELAGRAAAFLESKGAAVALPAFTVRTDGFGAGDLYVFVFDFHGTMLASGGWPNNVGVTVVGPADDGGPYARIRRVASSESGRGWVHYTWYSPCTHSRQPKRTYVIRVGPYIVGVGAYMVPGV